MQHEQIGFPIPESQPASTGAPSLGIQRTHYIALRTPDPEAAAQFAARYMGFDLVYADAGRCQYLAAHGRDPYSLVYTPGENGIDHISYVVTDVAALDSAEATLSAAGVETERIAASPLWRHEPALRFRTPGGHTIELTPGVNVPVPMAALVSRPQGIPGPISCDHVVTRNVDVEAELAFATGPFGLRESSTIAAPDGGAVLAFFRCRTLYHCYAVARAQTNGLHHCQFTLKDGSAVLQAHERLRDDDAVEIVWGPVRHGPGHNLALYFRDYAGNFVEFSAEEEIVLDNDTYAPQRFSVLDPRSADEWGTVPPAVFM